MPYESEATKFQRLFEEQKSIAIQSAIMNADAITINAELVEELIRRRDEVNELRLQNATLRLAYKTVALIVYIVTLWNIIA